MNEITRRDLLAASAAGVGIGTAGCTGSLLGDDGGGSADGADESESADGDGSPDSDGTDGTDGGAESADDTGDESENTDGTARTALPGLNQVQIENHHAESHTAHVLVENAGELAHWSSHDVAAGENVTLDRTWTDERGEFVVSFRIDDQTTWTQIDLTKERPNCYDVAPRITEDGTVKIWWMRNPDGCGGESV